MLNLPFLYLYLWECWERFHDTGDDEESNDSSSDLSIPLSSLEIGIYPEVYSSKYADDNSAVKLVIKTVIVA